MAGADRIVEIARFGQKKRDLLRRFRPFAGGPPSHDQPGDILAPLDAQAFQRCFGAWVAALTGIEPDPIAIDGKTSLRSSQKKGGGGPAHMVSAFAARQRLVLGQVKGLALEGNQGTLHDDDALFVAEQQARDFKDAIVSRDTIVDGDHGRIEKRTTIVIHRAGWLSDQGWPGLESIIAIDSRREIDGEVQTETRLNITSLVLLAQVGGPRVRSHWAIENSLHWVMDMIFRDDEGRVRTDHAPANLATIKHIAPNVTWTGARKRLPARQAKSRGLGRRLPRKPHPSLHRSPDCPVGRFSGRLDSAAGED